MHSFDVKHAEAVLEQVTDPEIPVLTIRDIGILRNVEQNENGKIIVTITPTYSGCPAMHAIQEDVKSTLQQAGFTDVTVNLVLSPAWTTDWMTVAGKEKLRSYGIAPPCGGAVNDFDEAVPLKFCVACPLCNSMDTQVVSEFGSTSCKALWKCNACKEPFDYFKPL